MSLHLDFCRPASALTHSALYAWGLDAAGLHLLQIPPAFFQLHVTAFPYLLHRLESILSRLLKVHY